jgi:hypothetical protein
LQDYNCYKPYQGTALIAAAHLGHDDVVRKLIAAKAPLDHVNNLGWTAVIESIVLGDGGTRHVATLKALVDAGANVNLVDRSGATPLTSQRGADTRRSSRFLKLPARAERQEGFEPYSPSSSLNRSTDTTRSSSAVLSTITPCVERPAMRMPDTGVRINLPASVTSIT